MEQCTLPPTGWWCSREPKHEGPCAARPLPRNEKVITVTIEENGDLTFLNTDSSDVFLECGEVVTRRASHVEPVSFGLRMLFHVLRWFGDKNQIAEWTRHWPCLWRVNTKPVGGPILCWKHCPNDPARGEYVFSFEDDEIAVWRDRKKAIDAEIDFLNNWFGERA